VTTAPGLRIIEPIARFAGVGVTDRLVIIVPEILELPVNLKKANVEIKTAKTRNMIMIKNL